MLISNYWKFIKENNGEKITDDSLLELIESDDNIIKEIDDEIAAATNGNISNSIDIAGDDRRLAYLGINTIDELIDAYETYRYDVVAFAKSWIKEANGQEFDTGISLFYLEYVLVAIKNDEKICSEYITTFISDDDDSAKYIIPTYLNTKRKIKAPTIPVNKVVEPEQIPSNKVEPENEPRDEPATEPVVEPIVEPVTPVAEPVVEPQKKKHEYNVLFKVTYLLKGTDYVKTPTISINSPTSDEEDIKSRLLKFLKDKINVNIESINEVDGKFQILFKLVYTSSIKNKETSVIRINVPATDENEAKQKLDNYVINRIKPEIIKVTKL